MTELYKQWKQTTKEIYEETPIIISQRHIKIPMSCPHCKKFTKGEIITVKTHCTHCKKDFEKDPLEDEINKMEMLRDCGWLITKMMAHKNPNEKNIPIQFLDRYEEVAQMLIDLHQDAWGLQIGNKKLKREPKNKPTIGNYLLTNFWTLELPEEITQHLE